MTDATRRLRFRFDRAIPAVLMVAGIAAGHTALADCPFCDTVLEGSVESFTCFNAQLDQLINEARQQTPIIVRLSCDVPDATVDYKNRLEILPEEGATGPISPVYILDLRQLECLADTLPAQLDSSAGTDLSIDLTACPT
ncbi:hypothetical protein [Tateyamaria sp. syn59]|uniref:hypothetical protein n=1 Tax=Tateyamaria sp. syn59 TaxID=2576942 RepID=UPI0011BF10BD|nr:hypothetical protein [Tateyamaria sp. syn59]